MGSIKTRSLPSSGSPKRSDRYISLPFGYSEEGFGCWSQIKSQIAKPRVPRDPRRAPGRLARTNWTKPGPPGWMSSSACAAGDRRPLTQPTRLDAQQTGRDAGRNPSHSISISIRQSVVDQGMFPADKPWRTKMCGSRARLIKKTCCFHVGSVRDGNVD